MADHQIQLQPGDRLDVSVAECPPVIVEPEPEPPVEPPGLAGRPTFFAQDDTVRVEWTPAERATVYRITGQPIEEPFFVDQPWAFVPLKDGDWLCVEPHNAAGPAPDKSCNTYQAVVTEPPPEPEPEPPAPGDWRLVHDFSPAKGETLPEGVLIREHGSAIRETDSYRMIYEEGMLDGRGAGRIGIEKMPGIGNRLMTEVEFEISPDFEDHPVYNKFCHFRTKVPPQTTPGIPDVSHGAKFINRWKAYLMGHAGDSGTAEVKEMFTPNAGFKELYPAQSMGANTIAGNVRRDRMVGGQRHTMRVEWTWVRTDVSFPEGNWYRLRWWLDGELQGDFPQVPMWGGPGFWYWEIAPTWGGNGGHRKTKQDYMKIYRVKDWV